MINKQIQQWWEAKTKSQKEELKEKYNIEGFLILITDEEIQHIYEKEHHSEHPQIISRKGFKKGDKVKCLFGNSGNKFWAHRLKPYVTIAEVLTTKSSTPDKLIFENIDEPFYENDFEKVEDSEHQEKSYTVAEAVDQSQNDGGDYETLLREHGLVISAKDVADSAKRSTIKEVDTSELAKANSELLKNDRWRIWEKVVKQYDEDQSEAEIHQDWIYNLIFNLKQK